MTKQGIKKPLQGMLAGLVLASFAGGLSVSAATYTVQSGDTLSQIAQTNGIELMDLAKWNKLPNLDVIRVGQELRLSADITLDHSTHPLTEPNQANSAYYSSLSEADQAAKEMIAFKESSGSYTAQNGQYYGRYQLSLSYLNGDLSPENQERVADAYVANRYGSWSAALAFWHTNGWY